MPSIEAEMFKDPLMKRIAEGDETAVDEMTEIDLDMEEIVEFSVYTPLSLASNNGHLDIVERLLQIRAVRDNAAAFNNRAMFSAAQNGHLDIVERLLQIDAVRDNAAAFNNRALINAASNGHLNVVERLLQINSVIQNAANHNNASLYCAAENGHVEIVERLLQIGAVRENAAANNNYVLRFAASEGHLNIVETLLQIDAVRENAAANNNYVLWFAASEGHLNIVEALLQIGAVRENVAAINNRALVCAAGEGHLNIVERLLQIPAVRDNAAADNNYALISAATNGHLNIVERLLQIGAVRENVAAINNRALVGAATNGHSEISYILAKTQWPNGINDMPQNLRPCIPEIRKGEVLVKAREDSLREGERVLRSLHAGYTPTSTKELYLPPQLMSGQRYKTRAMLFNFMRLNVMRLVNEYSGTEVNIDTSRPTTEESTMISIRGLNLLKTSSSIMSRLEKARVEREEHEHSGNKLAIVPYRPRFNRF